MANRDHPAVHILIIILLVILIDDPTRLPATTGRMKTLFAHEKLDGQRLGPARAWRGSSECDYEHDYDYDYEHDYECE
jgi:hypothetical protein